MATVSYIPAGSNVTLRDSAGKVSQYITKKEIRTEDSVPSIHPSNDTVCRMTRFAGYEIYYQVGQERIRDEEVETSITALRPVMLFYDIPTNSGLYNPSAQLRRIGVRINLSCWVIPEGDIPYNLLNTLAEGGAVWYTIPFAPEAAKSLVGMAITSIRKELEEAITSANQAAERGHNRLETSTGGDEDFKAHEKHMALIRKRLESLLKDMENVVARFGINPNSVGLSGAVNAARGLNDAMQNRVLQYRKAVAELRAMQNDATANALANAMDEGNNVALIAADYIDENGGDGSGIRDAFQSE